MQGWLLVIELGDFTFTSATPLNDLLWFVAGLVILAGLSTAVLLWNRRAHRDPFI
jgi:hypothetical protein